MNKNDLVIYEFKDIDIDDLTEEQRMITANYLVSNVNIRKLEDEIHKCILNLSGVGGPSFGADISWLALDNQKRLELVHQLLYYLDIFKSDIKYLKKNLNKTYIDDEQIYSFLYYAKDLIRTILQYGQFKQDSIKEQLKQIEDRNKLLELLNGSVVLKLEKDNGGNNNGK